MNILVLGAGILGTTSAWYLRAAGHTVRVLERNAGPALETSFANGSQISVSYAEPWANPAAPLKIVKWLGREDAPLLFRPRADLHQWLWGLAFLRECLPARARFNTRQLVNLGLYSRASLIALRRELGLSYHHLEKGILHLYRTAEELRAATPGMRLMRDLGMDIRFLEARELATVEPSLAGQEQRFAGGVYAPEDETGDAFRFTNALAGRCAEQGVEFHYGTHVLELLPGSERIDGVRVRAADGSVRIERADAYVVALGSWSAPMLRRVGVSTLIYPAKGYSATLPITRPAAVTQTSLTDHSYKIVFSRLDDGLRVAGTAEFGGYGLALSPVRCAVLSQRAAELFPDALDLAAVRYWAGLRPATPSNLPYIGRSRLANLWLNTGHGTLGWTHGAGSGRALADLMSGRWPKVDFRFIDRYIDG